MPFEAQPIGLYGDTVLQYVPHEGWRDDYQRYLMARCDAHVELWRKRNV